MFTISMQDILDQILADAFTKTPVESKLFRVVIPGLKDSLTIKFPKTSKKMFAQKTDTGYKVNYYRLCDFDIEKDFYRFDPKEMAASSFLSHYKQINLKSKGNSTIYRAYYYISVEQAEIEKVASYVGLPNPCE